MWLAVETETIARQFYYAEMLGKPVLLNEVSGGGDAPAVLVLRPGQRRATEETCREETRNSAKEAETLLNR